MDVVTSWATALCVFVSFILWLFFIYRQTAKPLPPPSSSDAEAQLQHTMREFAAARKGWQAEKEQLVKSHRDQIAAIRASAIEFELEIDNADQAATKRLVDSILNKTKVRGERG